MGLHDQKIDGVPQFVSYFEPVVKILKDFEGRAEPKKIFKELINRYNIPDEFLEILNKNGGSKFENRVHFARFYLLKAGLIYAQKRGLWALTETGMNAEIDQQMAADIFRSVQAAFAGDEDEQVAPGVVDDMASEIVSYGVDDIIDEGSFLDREVLVGLVERLQSKKNLILQGSPGTGKTWLAKRLARALLGRRTPLMDQLRSVQFHPSLSYEDFVRGYRPSGRDLTLTDGIFLQIIEAAQAQPDLPHVLIIEEINRGNPAQIFGEMLTLLENTKRSRSDAIELAYRKIPGEKIYVPENLYIIGTMNVADRSLALVDLALRRRFAFANLEPLFNQSWAKWLLIKGIPENFISLVQERMLILNEIISQDRTLGPQFRVGHSYVTPNEDEIADHRNWFLQVVETEIGPLLEEYWFDAPGKAREAVGALIANL